VAAGVKLFQCQCGAQVFFDNSQCLTCGRGLGFVPDERAMVALAPNGEQETETPNGRYRKCANYAHEGVCNWLLPCAARGDLCQACELNNVIPDLSNPDNRRLWLEVEKAKRRLVYDLDGLGLPVVPKRVDAERGLSFDIKASEGAERVLTGHSDGLITLSLEEADAEQREKMRVAMKERYRTPLGHFRHEIGHYFWDRLVRDREPLEACRELFGDERVDYALALKNHYAQAPEPDYAERFISQYAASHPWEDFAETFAHYLHMIDTLETAAQFGFSAAPAERSDDFAALMASWYPLSVALNSLNRSMGMPDPYPFVLSEPIERKLAFVHRLISDARSLASS
jgi:hypothetical protein